VTSKGRPASSARYRRVIHVSCALHRGSAGFANLVVRQCEAGIELDLHVDGSCVITLDEAGAGVLRDALIEWLG
jgi:hypothetical protein